ncbi:hypothetical protein LCGC14_2085490 [marine sediment metagenome]|uniref:Uncharacterized protein n=1 Tax=marine sediment metagenome TaxID=412755 RepID=A0A0F9HBD0_9ZZZZ
MILLLLFGIIKKMRFGIINNIQSDFMSEPIQNYEINDIIAIRLNEKMSLKQEFKTIDLALEIINEFKGKDVLDFAILGYINKIIIDLTQNTRERKYAIPNESLKYFYSNISYKGSYEDFLQEFQCKIW